MAHPDAFASLLDHFDRDHGGAAAWLRTHGLDQHELHQLCRRLLTNDLAA